MRLLVIQYVLNLTVNSTTDVVESLEYAFYRENNGIAYVARFLPISPALKWLRTTWVFKVMALTFTIPTVDRIDPVHDEALSRCVNECWTPSLRI